MFVLGSVIHESPNLSLAKLLGSQQNLFFDPSAKNHQHKTYKTALLFCVSTKVEAMRQPVFLP